MTARERLTMRLSAVISPCGTWRYRLGRTWTDDAPSVAWVMLNPSTADETRDDPTIRRCMGFALNWGFGGIDVYNLFALRSRHTHSLVSAPDAIGPENDEWLRRIPAEQAVVVAWGSFTEKLGTRDKDVLEMFSGRKIECVGFTLRGYPRHPLYVPYKAARETFPAP